MPEKISFECPGCFAKLSTSDRSKLAKKIRCPKCSEVFKPEVPDEDNDLDDFDEEVEDEPKAKTRRSKSSLGSSKKPAKKSKKGKKSGGSSLPLVIGGVIGLLVLVGVGLFFSGMFGTRGPYVRPMTAAEKEFGLRWMPAEADLIIHVKIADLWQTPLLKEPLNDPALATPFEEFKKRFGILPNEIESISIGVVDFTGGMIRTIDAGPPATGIALSGASPIPSQLVDSGRYVAVVKTKKPIDLTQLSQNIVGSSIQERVGKQYLDIPATPSVSPAAGGWSPNSNTLIFATTNELFAAMDRGETVTPRKEFVTLNHLPHLMFAGAIRGLKPEEIRSLESNKRELPVAMGQLMKDLDPNSVQLSGLSLTVRGGFEIQRFASIGKPENAKKMKEEWQTGLNEQRTMMQDLKPFAPPWAIELGEMLLTNSKIEEKNQQITMTSNIPDSAQQKLEEVFTFFKQMSRPGGLGGMGGPPIVPPNISPGNPSLGDPPTR